MDLNMTILQSAMLQWIEYAENVFYINNIH